LVVVFGAMASLRRIYLLACLVAGGVSSTSLEPEPDMYSTSYEPAPAADTTSSLDGETSTSDGETSTSPSATGTSSAPASGSTTSAAPAPTYTINLDVVLNRVENLTNEAALMSTIQQAVQNASTDGASVEVVIASVQVTSVFGNLPSIIVDRIAQAVADMSGVGLAQITVNGQKHSSHLRRLLDTATCITTVEKSASTDIVEELKRIHSTQTADALTTQLRNGNATAYQNVNASMTSTPTIRFKTTTIVTGADTAPSTLDLTSQVGAATGGAVEGLSVTSSDSTPTSTSPVSVGDPDHAPIAPMMTMWAVLFAFAMN